MLFLPSVSEVPRLHRADIDRLRETHGNIWAGKAGMGVPCAQAL
jgi:hypothetical protein